MDLDIVYPGIDHERYEHSVLPAGFHSRWGLDHRKLTVLYVGALVERKGPQVLLTAMGGLGAQARAVAQAVFIGPDLGGLCDLRAAAARHASGLVHVIGEVDAEQVDAFYRLADIFVFPTITEDEGFGLVAAEAAASGCAIVASRIGAIPEVVSEGVNATLVPPNDAAALAGALTRLIEDERRRSSYQEGSPGVARKFSWRQTADQIDRMLRDLLIA
jgi:glycosyltransferase involved in cell wall biosynthesis